MDEILALQKMLAEAQQTSTVNKLSDRVVVDLVEKIIRQNNFKLIYTLDGQEYITPQFLERQIYETVQACGRINLYDLPNKLNVGLDKIEQRLESMLVKYKKLIKLND